MYMKPARGPQTMFLGSYCSEIPGLANYEMPNAVCEGNFWGTFFRQSRLGRQPAILESRLLAAELGQSRLVEARAATSNPGKQATGR